MLLAIQLAVHMGEILSLRNVSVLVLVLFCFYAREPETRKIK
jgi:hypothetical protein